MIEVYKYFLSDYEIQSMLNNRDIWKTSDEVSQRLEALQTARSQEAAKESKE